MTDIANDVLNDVPRDESVSITVGGHQTLGIFPIEHGQPEATMVAITGSSGYLEIGIVGMSMSEMLGISQGQAVALKW